MRRLAHCIIAHANYDEQPKETFPVNSGRENWENYHSRYFPLKLSKNCREITKNGRKTSLFANSHQNCHFAVERLSGTPQTIYLRKYLAFPDFFVPPAKPAG